MKKFIFIYIFFVFFACDSDDESEWTTLYREDSSYTTIKQLTYEKNEEIIGNPDRGFHKYTNSKNNLNENILKSWKNGPNKITVIYRLYLLDSFFNSEISPDYLAKIQNDFDIIKRSGMRVILRFAYSDNTNDWETKLQQPEKVTILNHIKQLSNVINKNKALVYSIQAGFIGTWGEFYYTGNSSEFGHKANINKSQWQSRKEIIDALLNNFSKEIYIQVRYPGVKLSLYGYTNLESIQAYSGQPAARIGFFNDAFLSEFGDQGSYSGVLKCNTPINSYDFKYLSNETKYVPMTGEVNAPGTSLCSNFSKRRSGANAIKELDLANWSLINIDYYVPFWESLSSLDYSEIAKRIGYRYILKSSILQKKENTYRLKLVIENIGFSRSTRKRKLYLVIINKNTKAEQKFLINSDPRKWDKELTITHKFSLKEKGTYNLFLELSDYEIRNDPNYKVQFANKDTWINDTGYNKLSIEFDD